jgi:hypothetical protein
MDQADTSLGTLWKAHDRGRRSGSPLSDIGDHASVSSCLAPSSPGMVSDAD